MHGSDIFGDPAGLWNCLSCLEGSDACLGMFWYTSLNGQIDGLIMFHPFLSFIFEPENLS